MEIDIPPEKLVMGDTAFFTFTTKGYIRFTKNLHASLLRVSPYLAERLIVFCPDEETRTELEEAQIYAINCNDPQLPAFSTIAQEGFGRTISYKWHIASQLLKSCKYIWWCDSDIVVKAPILRHIKVLSVKYDCDLLIQYEWPKHYFNAGFWIARKSSKMERFFQDMSVHLEQSNSDQGYLNDILKKNRLHVCGLDSDKFMCGNRIYYKYFFQPECYLMHFNYTSGQRRKEKLMLGLGVWYLDASFAAVLEARVDNFLRTILRKIRQLKKYKRVRGAHEIEAIQIEQTEAQKYARFSASEI